MGSLLKTMGFVPIKLVSLPCLFTQSGSPPAAKRISQNLLFSRPLRVTPLRHQPRRREMMNSMLGRIKALAAQRGVNRMLRRKSALWMLVKLAFRSFLGLNLAGHLAAMHHRNPGRKGDLQLSRGRYLTLTGGYGRIPVLKMLVTEWLHLLLRILSEIPRKRRGRRIEYCLKEERF